MKGSAGGYEEPIKAGAKTGPIRRLSGGSTLSRVLAKMGKGTNLGESTGVETMPELPASEFDGHRQRNTIAPPVTPRGHPGHQPTNTEKVRLLYLTGQDTDSTKDPDEGDAFNGTLPLSEAEQINPPPEKYFK